MLQVAAHHRDHLDVLADAFQPGQQAADAAHVDLDRDAGLGRAVELLDQERVGQRVHLQPDQRVLAVLARLDRLLDLVRDALARVRGGDEHLAEVARARVARQQVEHLRDVGGDVRVGREEPEVLVDAGGLGVVVACADLDVVAHACALAPDDQERLRVRLQPGQPVHDVCARLFQRARPADVAALVEAGLHLDHADRLLAALGGGDERRDQGRVRRCAVHRHLYCQDGRVVDCLLDHPLDRRAERVVWVVHEQVLVAHGAQDVGGLAFVAVERRRHDRRENGIAKLSAVDLVELPQVAEVEHAVDVEDVLLVDLEPVDQALAHVRAHVGPDLEPHHLSEAAAAQLVLDCAQQVVGLIRDREVGVARDAEDARMEDLHAGEQRFQMARDHGLERDERVVADLEEARQHLLRHLHARESLGAVERVAQQHSQAQ